MLCVSATMWAAAAARLDVGQKGLEEGEGGVEGRESADGVEQRADVMAAHEAKGDDGDEAMAGDENISMQHAEGGGGSSGGIKKGKRRRGNRKCAGHRQRQLARGGHGS